MAGLFDQFAAFSTDNVGLERILRGLQSIVQIFVAWPLLFTYGSSTPSIQHLSLLATSFNLLQGRIGVARRVLRTFRFLDSFAAGWRLYARQDAGIGLETWLDVLSKTALGMWGMLDSVTLLNFFDDVPGMEILGRERTREYGHQSQIFWFIALASSVLGGLLKMRRIREERLGGAGEGEGKDLDEKKQTGKGSEKSEEKSAVVDARKDERASAELRQLTTKLVANTLDMIIPASLVGWVDVDRGIVASVMLLTTFITGKDVWQRCGRDVDAKTA